MASEKENTGNARAEKIVRSIKLSGSGIGDCLCELERAVVRVNGKPTVTFNASKIDRFIGEIRADLVRLDMEAEKIGETNLVDSFSLRIEGCLEVIISMVDFVRDADERSIDRDYPAMEVEANAALAKLFGLLKLDLPVYFAEKE